MLFCSSLPLVGSCDVSQSALAIATPAFAAVPGESHDLTPAEQRRYSAVLENILLRDMDKLQGLHSEDVDLLLAQPSLKRKDGPVEVWQYRSASCVLDVYIDADHARDAVLHYELRQRDKAYLVAPTKVEAPDDQAACFRSILASSGAHQGHKVALARFF